MVMFGQQEMYIHAKHFREKVNNCIDSSEEILSFYEALKSYTRGRKVDKLISDLLPIINTPKRYVLFHEVGSLLQPDDCQEFVSKIPIPPSEGIRIVKIQKVASESLGVGIRGGKEHGVGVFISSVVRGSRGDIAGLKAGDEVLLVNGFTIRESTHSEVVSLIRNRRNLRIKVRSTGKYPDRINGKLIWKSMDDKENVFRYNANILNHLVSQLTLTRNQSPVLQIRDTDKHVKFVVGPQGLGCDVKNGIPSKHGIFVIHVNKHSLADRVGIAVGDQIITLNKKNFTKIQYAEAVQLLKTTKEYDMVLRPCNDAKQFIELKYLKGADSVSIHKTLKEDNEDTTAGKDNTRLAPSSSFKSSNDSNDQLTDSTQLYDKAKKKRSSSIKDLKLSEKNNCGLQSKSALVEKDSISVVIATNLDENDSHHSAIVNSDWSFAQKDFMDSDENDSVFNTKF